MKFGAEEGSRTRDLLITNQLLYQLSYFGLFFKIQFYPQQERDHSDSYRKSYFGLFLKN